MARTITQCKFDGCDRLAGVPGSGRGYCTKHYLRLRRNGDPAVSKYDREQTGKPCKYEGCERSSGFKGFCSLHGNRVRKHGDPSIASVSDKYRCKINWIEENSGHQGNECLIWPFGVSDNGRGIVGFRGSNMSAPKAMCFVAHGNPPTPKHEAAHSCGRGHDGCMNPKHLRWATRRENEADKRFHGTLRRGADINTSKLTEADVKSIRTDSEMTGVDLAQKYGVTPSSISNVRLRKSWAWLD